MMFAVYPIFGFMPVEKGGLGLSGAKIGVHMSFRAVTHILVLIPYPYLERRFGLMRTYRFSMLLFPMAISLFPLLNLVARKNGEDGWLWYGCLFVFFMVWAFTGWTWSKCGPPLIPFDPHLFPAAMFIMVNNASPKADAISSIHS